MATTRYGFSFEEMKARTLASWVRKNLKARLFFGKSKTQFLGDLGTSSWWWWWWVLLLLGCSAAVS